MSSFLGANPGATTITKTWENVSAGDIVGPFPIPGKIDIVKQIWELTAGTATVLENPELNDASSWTPGEGKSQSSAQSSFITEATLVTCDIPGKEMWARPNPDAGSNNTITMTLLIAYRLGTGV